MDAVAVVCLALLMLVGGGFAACSVLVSTGDVS